MDGYKTCTMCDTPKTTELFYKRHARCKSCFSESKKNYSVSVDKKMCFRCKVVKSKTEFNFDKSNRTGLHSSCKTCKKEIDKESLKKRLKDVKYFL